MSSPAAAMKHDKEPGKEIAYAKKAMALMQQHGIMPTPENYGVWYHYAIGKDPNLLSEVDKVLRSHMPFTDDTCSYLYNKFITAGGNQKIVDQAADNAQNILLEVVKVIHDFSDETKSYNQGVDEYLENITHKFEDSNIKDAVKDLINATATLRRRGEKIHHKLEESTAEINTLKKNLHQVTIESQRDFLTGVFNRKTFEKFSDEQMEAARASNTELCLMMIDVDHFKKFNDRFGHLLGDEVLKIVARTLIETLKGRDIVARFGGEEFVVILPETPIEGAMKVAEIVRLAIAGKELKRKDTGQTFGSITVSIGVARFRPDDSLPFLIKRADDALYLSKNGGRNRVSKEAQ